MAITLAQLPYEYTALEPYISDDTLQFHHDKHHKKYVDELNKLITGTKYDTMTLEEIVKATASDDESPSVQLLDDHAAKEPADGTPQHRQKIFNNAAQAWNHDFYWECLRPGENKIPADLEKALTSAFGSVSAFKTHFKKAATEQFGSGWAWLVYNNGNLAILKTGNAETPLAHGMVPLLTCDVWEHAYYLDFQNKRPDYVDVFTDTLANWEFVAKNWRAAVGQKIAA